MITTEYDPRLVEQAVYLAARRNAATECELHRDLDPLYEIREEDERERRFQSTMGKWFSKLALDRFLIGLLADFPRIVDQVRRAIVSLAPRRKDESAELFVLQDKATPSNKSCTLVIQMCADSLVTPLQLREIMLRELQHVEDMLDPVFGYQRQAIDGLPAQQNIVRDRYRVLWDIYVEARLLRDGQMGSGNLRRLQFMFDRAFTVGGQRPPEAAFQRLTQLERVAHSQLLAWAHGPQTFLEMAENRVAETPKERMPGDDCPLCGFPTFDWLNRHEVEARGIVRRICEIKPDWTPDRGLCRRCGEMLGNKPCASDSAPRSLAGVGVETSL